MQALTSPPRPPARPAAAAAPSPPQAAPAARRRCCFAAPPGGGADHSTAARTAVVDLATLVPPGGSNKDPRVPEWLDTPLPDQRLGGASHKATATATAPTTRPPPFASGSIELLTGPMFSGKSTALLERVAELQAQGRDVAVVKPGLDQRYARNMVVSHAGKACPCFVCAERLSELPRLLGEARWHELDAVAIDEAQFFPDLVEFATMAAEGGGGGAERAAAEEAKEATAGAGDENAPTLLPPSRPKAVIVAGLSGDFKRRPFGRVAELLAVADRVSALRAVCFSCGADAPFSLRLEGGKGKGKQGDDGQVLVGGEEAYQPACRACFARHAAAAQAAAR